MRLSQKKLVIVANPFAAPLSAEGACMALAAADPAEGGARYIGARTTAKPDLERRSLLSLNGKALGRDKVSVVYDLRPVTVADTSYHRNLIKAGDVLVSPAEKKLLAAARASLAAFAADGGDRALALAAWRRQGLSSIADVLDPPAVTPPDGTPVTLSEGVVS